MILANMSLSSKVDLLEYNKHVVFDFIWNPLIGSSDFGMWYALQIHELWKINLNRYLIFFLCLVLYIKKYHISQPTNNMCNLFGSHDSTIV